MRMKSGKVLDCCLERRRTAMRKKKKEKRRSSLGIASYMGFAPSEAADKRRDPEWKEGATDAFRSGPASCRGSEKNRGRENRARGRNERFRTQGERPQELLSRLQR